MGTEFRKILLSQAEDICHYIGEARRVFGYRHYSKRLSSQSRRPKCKRSEGDSVDSGPGDVNNAELERRLPAFPTSLAASTVGCLV